MNYKRKLNIINNLLIKTNCDAIIFISSQNRYWISGFYSSFGYAIVNKMGITLLVDGRYYEKAKSTINSDLVQIIEYKSINTLSEIIKQNNIESILVESEYVKYDEYSLLKKMVKKILPTQTKPLRIIKDKDELLMIQKATNIAIKTLKWLKENIKPGMTEIQVANLSYKKMLDFGAEKQSFDTIVASGINGAYPHHRPTNKIINEGEFVTIDMGCVYKGYCSDITRTFCIGKPNNELLKEAYNVVLQANINGINAVKNGLTGSDVDKIVRDTISNTKFKDYFVHSTGHGVGIDVHELPNVSKTYKNKLFTNSVITIEPGIYIPNVGGIRIEDMVLVKNDGSIVLTRNMEK